VLSSSLETRVRALQRVERFRHARSSGWGRRSRRNTTGFDPPTKRAAPLMSCSAAARRRGCTA